MPRITLSVAMVDEIGRTSRKFFSSVFVLLTFYQDSEGKVDICTELQSAVEGFGDMLVVGSFLDALSHFLPDGQEISSELEKALAKIDLTQKEREKAQAESRTVSSLLSIGALHQKKVELMALLGRLNDALAVE